jgi:hypothetical protein
MKDRTFFSLVHFIMSHHPWRRSSAPYKKILMSFREVGEVYARFFEKKNARSAGSHILFTLFF